MAERGFPQLETDTRRRIQLDLKLLTRLTGIEYRLVAIEDTTANDSAPTVSDFSPYGNEWGFVTAAQAERMGVQPDQPAGQTEAEAV